MGNNSDTEKVPCKVLKETDKAFFLQDDFDTSRKAYFPKSQVSFERRNMKTGIAVAVIPLWLLEAKGWN